jgi:hypothetical protein
LFSVLDPHEEIYLVARIEKILDGKTHSSSLQPYLNSSSSPGTNMKLASKLNKKMKFICSRLGAYRMPFAWAAKPVFKKSINNRFTPSLQSNSINQATSFYNYVIDETDPLIFQHDVNHLSDEDLFKYLGDFHTKDKYLNKLIQINGKLEIKLQDMKAVASREIPSLSALKNIFTTYFLLFVLLLDSLSSSYNISTFIDQKSNDYILETDYFDPKISPNSSLTNENVNGSLQIQQNIQPSVQLHSLQSKNNNTPLVSQPLTLTNGTLNNNKPNEFFSKAKLLSVNSSYKNHLYVYPKSLKYDMQKSFQKVCYSFIILGKWNN